MCVQNDKIQIAPLMFALLFSAFFISTADASGRSHAAHEHGVASVNVVAEGQSVTVQLETPSESIYGFEHEAKNPADVKKRDAAVETLKSSADKMFVFDAALSCALKFADVKPFVVEENADDHGKVAPDNLKKTNNSKQNPKQKSGTHAEVHAVFKFECGKPVSGSKLAFATTRYFKSLRKLKVQVLSGERQDGGTINNDKGTVNL